MALTLIGFVGPIVGQPDLFGIEEKDREMAGFIHMWRVFGYLHGIEDEVSIACCDSAIIGSLQNQTVQYSPFEINNPKQTRISLFTVLEKQLIPNLHKPPEMFLPMSSAICAWAGPLNSFFRYLVLLCSLGLPVLQY